MWALIPIVIPQIARFLYAFFEANHAKLEVPGVKSNTKMTSNKHNVEFMTPNDI